MPRKTPHSEKHAPRGLSCFEVRPLSDAPASVARVQSAVNLFGADDLVAALTNGLTVYRSGGDGYFVALGDLTLLRDFAQLREAAEGSA